MSALALVASEWGADVGGSDRARSSYIERLEAAGIPVVIGHDATNVPQDAEVIVSSAVAADNPEVSRARVKRRRAELLAELVQLRPSIVVAGAHGKTTTSAMIAVVLDRRRDPAARGQRQSRRGVARCRGRRIRPFARAAAAARGGGDERRARPPRDLRLRSGGAGAVRALARACAGVGAGRRARAGRV